MSTRDELHDSLNRDEFWDTGEAIDSFLPFGAATVLHAEGWRKKPDRDEVAAALWNLPINGMDWRELNELADRDAADYAEHRDYALEQADAILALMDRGQ